MKIYTMILYTFVFGIPLFISSCSDNPSTSQIATEKNFFPVSDGTSYHYKLKEIDQTGVPETGNRYIEYMGSTNIFGVSYQNQIDSVAIGTINTVGITYFRKTSTGVFYYVDTTEVLSLIPDSLKSSVTFLDELRLLLFPLSEGSLWPTYRATVHLQSGVNFSPLNVNGTYLKNENLTINLKNDTLVIATKKVKYDLEIILNISEPKSVFSGEAWFAEDIGMVKMEGNAVLFNLLLFGEFNFVDSTTTVIQEIFDYDIK